MNAPAPRLRRLGVILIACGLAAAVTPTALVRIADHRAAGDRGADVDHWMRGGSPVAVRQTGPPRAPTGFPVIRAGPEGYLLEIPKLGLRAIVHELEPEVFLGRNTPRLKRFGLGQVPYSEALKNVAPGEEGTAVIAGHRTTSGAPFRQLDRLGPGDLIIIRSAETEQRWAVVYATTVIPQEVDAIRSRAGARRLVILACSPPFSAAKRLVVYASPVRQGEE
jgi:LPXTG-site transpeptidase (sortase) family protein